MRAPSRTCAVLVGLLPFAVPANAERGWALLRVSDLDGRPVRHVDIGCQGPGGRDRTDDDGRVRISLPPLSNPGDPLPLQLFGDAVRIWQFVSPWTGQGARIPSFEARTDALLEVKLCRRGDRRVLQDRDFQSGLAAQYSKLPLDAALDRKRLADEIATAFRLELAEINQSLEAAIASLQAAVREVRDEIAQLKSERAAHQRSVDALAGTPGPSAEDLRRLQAENDRLQHERAQLLLKIEALQVPAATAAQLRAQNESLARELASGAEKLRSIRVIGIKLPDSLPWCLGSYAQVNPDEQLMRFGEIVFTHYTGRREGGLHIPEIHSFSFKSWLIGGDEAVQPQPGTYVGRLASGGPVSLLVDDMHRLRAFRFALRSGGRKGLLVDLATLDSFPCGFANGYLLAYLTNTADAGAAALVLKGASERRIVGWALVRRSTKEEVTLVEMEAVPEGDAWR